VPDLRAVAAGQPPFWRVIARISRDAAARLPGGAPVVLCAHSNAGLFVPALAEHLKRGIAGFIFVDALLPPASGVAELAPARVRHDVEMLAEGNVVPRWTEWWPEEDVRALFPDEATRRMISAEVPGLPIAYYRDTVPVPSWQHISSAYVWFSAAYQELAERARGYGWPVEHLPGAHLHMLVEPERVARTLQSIASAWTPRSAGTRADD